MCLKCVCWYAIASVVWLTLHTTTLRAQAPSGSQGAADSSDSESWHFQYDLFQLLLERQGLAPVESSEQVFAAPADAVIVVAGDPKRLPQRTLNRLSQFVQRGGALLIATDNPAVVPGIARFVKGPVVAGNPKNSYQNFADCVQVTAVADDARLSGVTRIITNISGWLRVDASGPFAWETLASFPDDCFPKASQGQPLLAIGHSADDGAGTIVLSADASLFTNGMLWHGDNAILAIRVATLLAGTGRKRMAFWVDGHTLTDVNKRLAEQARVNPPDIHVEQPLPEPELDKVLKLFNALAREVAQSNVLNETLKQRPRHIRPAQYFRFLLIAATMLLFAAAAWILLTTGALRPFLTRRRKVAPPLAAGQRTLAANPSGDFRTPAGYLAREFCWELTGSRQSADWQQFLAQRVMEQPALSPSDQHDLAKIIDIAGRGCRERVTISDFQQLGKTIAALRAKHLAAGQLETALPPTA